jgi:uncharacterized phage protein gp47/JayE
LPVDQSTFYKTRDEILSEMLTALQTAIPDVYQGEDGVVRIIFEIEAGQYENSFLANQLLLEDIFIQTAGLQALLRHGEQHNLLMDQGSKATGILYFTGDGGTFIPIGTEVGSDPGAGLDVIYFVTSADGTIPNPGIPTAPTAAINVAAGNLNGLYEYEVTFYTAGGETLPSSLSNAVSPVNQQVDLTAIPLGGAGTVGRRIYRRKGGAGDIKRVTEIANNTATTYTDNITDGAVNASSPAPTVNTANSISLTADAEENGSNGNAAPGTIIELTNAPPTLATVTNPAAFTGGSDPEDTEEYRAKLLGYVQTPQTGSPADLKIWAEEVDGVETATVFTNDNLGTAQNGHTTVRIAGPNGIVPDGTVVANVQAALEARIPACIILHVTTFTPVSTNVTVDVTVSGTYTLADVTPDVQQAVKDYINSLDIGGTLYLSGIVDAVFGRPGIADVVVTTPASNQTTGATSKRTPGTITVT